MGEPAFRLIDNKEANQLGQNLAPAFFDDPMAVFLMPDREKRVRQIRWFFTFTYSYAQRWGTVYANDDLSAGSAWLKPGHTSMTSLNMLRVGLWKAPFTFGMSAFARLGKFSEAADKVHKRLAPGDHWYLLALGVAPDSQKKGLGSGALNAGLEEADATGLPVYLETMTEANVDYYLKRGFEVAEKYEVESAVTTWAMIRQS